MKKLYLLLLMLLILFIPVTNAVAIYQLDQPVTELNGYTLREIFQNRNRAIPDLSTATDLGGGVYKLKEQNGGTLTYDVYNGEYRLFGNLIGVLQYNFGYIRPSADNAYIQIWKTKQVVWENNGDVVGFGGPSVSNTSITKK